MESLPKRLCVKLRRDLLASNSFGKYFRITTWGESHGKAIGVVVDGCPSGLCISKEEIDADLAMRAPGKKALTSPRKEADSVEILSGLFEGKTTGAPICLMITNTDADSSSYAAIKNLLRPGHANYTYLKKYGIFDERGGGRASARETASRVAAGSIAKKWLKELGIEIKAHLSQIGSVSDPEQMEKELRQAESEGDSLGGIVSFEIIGLPPCLGDPVYDKIEALLGFALLSIPATKGFEIGEGFGSALMRGSLHNDLFASKKGAVVLESNHAGGVLGGISTGEPLYGRVAFKPASSIAKSQKTVDKEGRSATLTLPEGSRHDPCVAVRAVPVVCAMCALVIADLILANRLARI